MTEVVKIYQLVENLSLEVVYGDEESLNRTIKTGEISRPGLELTGYFNYYSHDRLESSWEQRNYLCGTNDA